MLDSVVKIAEKIVELLKYRELRRDRQFKVIIEPMFNSARDVHKDYLKMFDRLKRDALEGADVIALVQTLTTLRIEHETTRRTIQAQARTLKGIAPDFGHFIYVVAKYLNDSPLHLNGLSISNSFSRYLNRIEEEADPAVKQRLASSIVSNIDGATEHLRQHWEVVTRNYAEALANYAE